jgi:hypothetical protein
MKPMFSSYRSPVKKKKFKIIFFIQFMKMVPVSLLFIRSICKKAGQFRSFILCAQMNYISSGFNKSQLRATSKFLMRELIAVCGI